ncbi:MAG: 50S ribosomal protein L24 [Alphaproteobacteria bacterium]
MPKLKIKKGDNVVVITGNDKGKTGEVLKALPAENKVLVSGVNLVKKHNKPSQNQPGGIVTKEAYINVSNVALVDSKTGKPTKVSVKEVDGKKVRVAKKSGETV